VFDDESREWVDGGGKVFQLISVRSSSSKCDKKARKDERRGKSIAGFGSEPLANGLSLISSLISPLPFASPDKPLKDYFSFRFIVWPKISFESSSVDTLRCYQHDWHEGNELE
jgi:hypothetical protein